MSVISVKETHLGRGADVASNKDGKTDGSLVRSFVVLTDAIGTGPVSVDSATPARYSTYSNGTESSGNWILKRKRFVQDAESPKVWRVDCEYEPLAFDGEDEPDPTLRPPRVSYRTVYETREMIVDSTGREVKNSVGEPFDQPTEEELSATVIVLSRYESSYSSKAADVYKNTLNDEPFFDYPAGYCRMVDITGESETDPDLGTYFAVSYEIHVRNEEWIPTVASAQLLPSGATIGPWDVTRRNVGFRYKKSSGGDELIVAKDFEGMPETTPVDLDDDGTKLPDGDDPFYWVFKPYARESWAPLDLE